MIFPYINPSLAGGVNPYSYPTYSGIGYNLVDWSEFGGGIADGFNSTIDGVKYLFTHPGDSLIHFSKMISTNPMDIPYKYKVGQTMISDIVTYTTESSGSRVAGRAGYEIIVTGLGAKGVTSAPKLVKGLKGPKGTGKNITNYKGESIKVPEGHKMSPRDPDFSEPPIYEKGPFTTKQREEFIKGNSGGTKLSPHHRHQIPTTHGGVIDEIPGPGHPSGNKHTAGTPNRHPNKSIFNDMEGGNSLRQKEIREHWKNKGNRLIEVKPGVWRDPGLK